MTLEELIARGEIRATLAAYNSAGDQNDAEGYAGVFTTDGILESGGTQIKGRDVIRHWKAERAKTAPAKFVRHNLTTCLIEVTGPETATARTYFQVLTEVGPDHAGYYSDDLRKEDGRWLIAHRKVRLDWFSPDSRFGRLNRS